MLRVLLELDGEVVTKAIPDLGYLHRGIEKMASTGSTTSSCPGRTAWITWPLSRATSRFVKAVEDLMGIEIPERAQYLRVIFSELQRIASHLLWLAHTCMDLGAMTVFLYAMRERELILDMLEMQPALALHSTPSAWAASRRTSRPASSKS